MEISGDVLSTADMVVQRRDGPRQLREIDDDDDNNNNHDSVYGAVIMTKVIARVHPVHLMNVDWGQVAANPQTKPINLGLS